MKKLFTIFLSFLMLASFAQDEKDAISYKNEGIKALNENNYEAAYENYKNALDLFEKEGTTDTALTYYTGYAAYKLKNYENALPYLTKSIELDYKTNKSYQYKANCLYKTKKYAEAKEFCIKGLELFPETKSMKTILANCYMKEGNVFYKKGNGIKKAANESGMNETDPTAFKAEYAKADEQYNLALPIMMKAYETNPKSKSVLKALKNIYTNLDKPEDAAKYEAELDAL